MNEPPLDEKPKPGAAAGAASYVPQSGITNQRKSLWDDEAPAAGPAPDAGKPAEAAASAPEAAAAAPAPKAAASAGGAPPEDAKEPGWWKKMENGVLNAPPEAEDTHARGGHVPVPEFGGRRYGSIFDNAEPAAAAGEALSQWAPFTERPAPAAPATCATVAAGQEEDWSGFQSANNRVS